MAIYFLDLADFEPLIDNRETNFINVSLTYLVGALKSMDSAEFFSYRSNLSTNVLKSILMKRPRIILLGTILCLYLQIQGQQYKGDFLTLETLASLTEKRLRI